jgi:hypothetical protein
VLSGTAAIDHSAALQSTKIIVESLTQFAKVPDTSALPDLENWSVAS